MSFNPFVSNSNIHKLLCWIPNCKYFFCYVYICPPLAYLNYSSHISSMTVRNVNLCFYVNNCYLHAYLKLLSIVVQYLNCHRYCIFSSTITCVHLYF